MGKRSWQTERERAVGGQEERTVGKLSVDEVATL